MKQLLLAIPFAFLFANSGISQEFPYTLNTFQDTYEPLSEAIAVTPANDPEWDDPENNYYELPLGFEFQMLGRSGNALALIDPGCQLVLGVEADTVAVFSPYYADIRNADTSEVVSSIVYTTEGLPGSRIFKVEWKNVGFFNEFDLTQTFTSTSNFQVWLYETSNDIEFRYGPNTITDATLIHDQWPAAFCFFMRDFLIQTQLPTDSWSLMGPVENPIVGPINIFQMPSIEELLIGEPSNGLVYHFGYLSASIGENTQQPSYSVFPTIANTHVMTYWASNEAENLRVFDLNGKLVMTTKIQRGNTVIDITTLTTGTYFFTVGEGPAIQTQRIIKP